MSVLDQNLLFERLQFFNGQRLFASDLQALEDFDREMRWLHNRSLHQPGIGNGFEVIGKKSDREVSIMPGYAIDALGREIVLTGKHTEPVPPMAGDEAGKPVFYDLTVSYPEDTELEEVETRAGVCLPRGVVRLREEPIFCWIRLGRDGQAIDDKLKQDVQRGLKIVLARAEVLNCQLESDISVSVRRSARPTRQPYIACGKVNNVNWKIENFPIAPNNPTIKITPTILPFYLKATISTSNSHFESTPCYFAKILGQRVKKIMPNVDDVYTALVDTIINIFEPSSSGFSLQVVLLAKSLEDIDRDYNFPTDIGLFSDWQIVWMGIEG